MLVPGSRTPFVLRFVEVAGGRTASLTEFTIELDTAFPGLIARWLAAPVQDKYSPAGGSFRWNKAQVQTFGGNI